MTCYARIVTHLGTIGVVALLTARLVAADVFGVVRDGKTGEPIPGAVVVFEDLGRAAITDEDGAYRLVDVPAGPQHLSVRLLGFRTRSIHLLVPADGALHVDLVLHSDPIEVEAVIARSRIPIRGVDEAGPDLDPTRRLSAAAIRNDPFTAEPDVLQALVGGAVGETPESGGGLHVRGGDVDEVGYLLDGFPIFSPYHSGVRSGAWSPSAVERIEIRTDPTLAAEGLSGQVLATTIEPGERTETSGEVSTSQVSFTVDGPLLRASGFVLAGRTGYPGLIHPPEEPSYLGGEDHDVIAKLVVPVGGGELRILGFENHNVVRTSSRPSGIDDEAADPGARNRYAWRGRTLGLAWEAARTKAPRIDLRAWRSNLDASFLWHGGDAGPSRVESDRTQHGFQAGLGWEKPWGSAEIGARTTIDQASYDLSTPAHLQSREIAGRRDEVAAFARFARGLGERFEVHSGLLVESGDGEWTLAPRIAVLSRIAGSVSIYAEYVRSTQALQSLRNPESVVGRVFPAELYAGGGESGVPNARSDLGVLGLVAVPGPGVRVELEAYARSMEGLAVTDPDDGKPFADDTGRRGSGTARGGSVQLSVSAARYAALASFGVDRVEFRAGGTEWVPGYSAERSARVGAIAFPTPSLSIRVGWIGQFGRRGTDTVGFLEWESCNLLDLGCEFAGSPEELGELGARELPAYQRVDLSIRKHWHVDVAGRDARIEAFATGSNLLGRSNVLAFVVDPGSGEAAPLEMRPRAPLTLGLGWSF